MVTLKIIRTVVGFSLKGVGLFWSIFDKFLCGTLCRGSCSVAQDNSCSLLFLFVGIIFIVCGYALIVMKDDKRKSLKNRIKKAIKSV
jgi:hypothetical protein